MGKLTYNNKLYGRASVFVGLVSIALWPTALMMTSALLLYTAPVVAIPGLALGVLSVRTSIGAAGIFLSMFGLILPIFTIIGFHQIFAR